MFFLFAGVVAFLLSLVLWPWNLLFSRIYENLKPGKYSSTSSWLNPARERDTHHRSDHDCL
jgi:hypothetical protein